MADWTASMKQSFEYYTVDPTSWRDVKRLENVISCTIDRDAEAETLGSAKIEATDLVGECYIRVYMIVDQDGITEKLPLGTFLVQTPASSFDGKVRNVTMDAYTPLLELKESPPPLGYSVAKGVNVMEVAHQLVRERTRAPVVSATSEIELFFDFVADPSDTWLSFLTGLIANAGYGFSLDEMGRILFIPKQDAASLQSVWLYDDGNSSILYPEMELDHDLYGVPNVVEVVYSGDRRNYCARAVNDDPNSPLSTVNRGREIIHRVTDPEFTGEPTQGQLQEYAMQVLRDLSALEYTVSYTHGFCPSRVWDCVRLNYDRAGIQDIKAQVISQSITCEPGCPVNEKAVFTTKLWE